MAQYRYAPLALKGNEKSATAPTDRLCNMHGCFKYINAGDDMIRVRRGGFDLHPACAVRWCDAHGVDHNYS